jgi:hypothetical protein
MKLHDTRSGELIAGSVASGANADELDQALRPAVEKLLIPLRPERMQDALSDRRKAAREAPAESAMKFTGGLHAAAGFGSVAGTGALITIGNTDPSGSGVALAGGADVGIRIGSVLALGVFGEILHVAGTNALDAFGFGGLLRFAVSPELSFAAGAGGASFSGKGGWMAIGEAGYRVLGPLALHAQVEYVVQSKAGDVISGVNHAFAVLGGVSLLW